MYRYASELAAVEKLAFKLRGALEDLVVFQLNEASKVVQAGLQRLYLFELEVADATHAQEEATKKLKKAQAAFDASQAEATKAGKIVDAEKREKASALPTRHLRTVSYRYLPLPTPSATWRDQPLYYQPLPTVTSRHLCQPVPPVASRHLP